MRSHRLFVGLGSAFVLAANARAEEKPNTLTAKEAAEGWVLLFDGETAFGWGPTGVKPTNEKLKPEPTTKDDVLTFFGPEQGALKAYPTVGLGDYEMTFEARRTGASNASLGVVLADEGESTLVFDADALCPNANLWTPLTLKSSTAENGVLTATFAGKRPIIAVPVPGGLAGFTSRLAIEV